jgi:hypothetical protein
MNTTAISAQRLPAASGFHAAARAELALHALILSPERPVIATGDFSAALASAYGRTTRAVDWIV